MAHNPVRHGSGAMLIAAISLLIIMVGYGLLTYGQYKSSGTIACQTRYFRQLGSTLTARSVLADRTSAANEKLQAAEETATGQAAITARETYIAAMQAIDQQRASKQIPVEHC